MKKGYSLTNAGYQRIINLLDAAVERINLLEEAVDKLRRQQSLESVDSLLEQVKGEKPQSLP